MDAETGALVWKQSLGSRVWGSTLCADGKVYVGTQGRKLWVMRAGREKEVLATIPLHAAMYTTPVAADGVLYIATDKYLYAVAKPVGTEETPKLPAGGG